MIGTLLKILTEHFRYPHLDLLRIHVSANLPMLKRGLTQLLQYEGKAAQLA